MNTLRKFGGIAALYLAAAYHMIWFVWLGIVLLRGNLSSAEQPFSPILTTTP